MQSGCRIVLEFARARDAGDPHAFRFAPQEYLVRTAGGGFEGTTFPWDQAVMRDLDSVRRHDKDGDAQQRLGETLRKFLAPTGWSTHEQAIVAAVRDGAPVSITIRSAAAELYALPWELLRLKTTGQLIGGVPGIVVRYEWPDTQSFPDRATGRQEGGRILVAWSSAAGSVPLTEHLAAVRAAFDASPDPGAFDDARDVIAHASFGAIADALARAARDGPPVDVLHILCHGARKGDSYGLALDPEPDADDDAPAILDPARLQQLLAPHLGMLRLVVLAACDSGNSGAPGNLVGSAAQMVHRAGARAVIASRYPLSTAGSTRMSEALYRAIFSRREPLEQGFLDARQALLRESGRLDWASIQLYAREADGDATPIAVIAPAPAEPVALPPSPTASRRLPLIAAAVGLAGVVAGGLWFAQSGAPGPEDMKSTTEAAPAKAVIDGTTGAPPVPAPEDLPPEEPTTGDAPDTDDATTTGEPSETKATVAKKVAPKKVTPKTVGKCPRSITARVRNLFSDSKTLADGVKIVVEVDERGGVSVVKPRSGAARSQVQDKLEALSASQLTREPDALPCKTEEFTWLP